VPQYVIDAPGKRCKVPLFGSFGGVCRWGEAG
jgi:hypothetical protein